MSTHQRKCPCCGKMFWDFTSTTDGRAFNKAWKGLVCHDCASWLRFIKEKSPNREVIAGVCYDFLPPQTVLNPGDMLGGGHMKYILKKDNTIKKSNDIWKIGEVPLQFRELLPDTGWWITRRIYYRLKRGFFDCENVGCFDRYHCLRYDVRKEYGKGPYNMVPKTWQVGNEKCPSFCNILDIEHYDGFETLDV